MLFQRRFPYLGWLHLILQAQAGGSFKDGVAFSTGLGRLQNSSYEESLAQESCAPGFGLLAGDCLPCPAGSFRRSDMVSCHQCPTGTYAAQPGQAECQLCAKGTDCGIMNLSQVPQAAAGYFLFPLPADGQPQPWSYMPCDPPEVCLGGNECSAHNVGTMCQQCEAGYTNRGNLDLRGGRGLCTACPSSFWNLARGLAFSCVYVLYIYVIFRATISSAMSIRHLQSVILKITINYLVFAYVAIRATGFWDDLSEEIQTAFYILSPTKTSPVYISLDCMLQESGITLLRAHIVFALVIIPLVLLLNLLAMVLRNWYLKRQVQQDGILPDSLAGLDDQSWAWGPERCEELEQVSKRRSSKSSQQFLSRESSKSEALSKTPAPLQLPVPHRQDQCDLETGEVHGSHLRKFRSRCTSLNSSMVVEESILNWKEFKISFVQTSIVWAFVLYPGVVEGLLRGIMCQEFDALRLRGHLDIVCFQGDHSGIFIMCATGLLVYGVGLPLLLFFLLHRNRADLGRMDIRRKYGFLYNGFEFRCYHFECIYMFRKLFLLFASSIPQQEVRISIMLCLGLLYFTQHVRVDPFDNRDHQIFDRLEILNLWSLVVTLLARLLLDARNNNPQGGSSMLRNILQSPFFETTVVVIVILSHVAFWYSAGVGLVRNLVVRTLRLKQVMGMELRWWHRVLLSLERTAGLGNTMTFRVADRTLDTSRLSARERHFLQVSLRCTLQCYMQCSDYVQPALVTLAVREAVRICRRTRRLQAEWLRAHKDVSVPMIAALWGTLRAILASFKRIAVKRCPCTKRIWGSLTAEGATDQPRKVPLEQSRSLSLLRMPGTTPWGRRGTHNSLEDDVHDIFVEELYDALMVLWPEILQGWAELHRLPEPTPPPTPQQHVRVWDESLTMEDFVPLQRDFERLGSEPLVEGDEELELPEEPLPTAEAEPAWLHQMLQTEADELEKAKSAARLAQARNLRLASQLSLAVERQAQFEGELEAARAKLAVLTSVPSSPPSNSRRPAMPSPRQGPHGPVSPRDCLKTALRQVSPEEQVTSRGSAPTRSPTSPARPSGIHCASPPLLTALRQAVPLEPVQSPTQPGESKPQEADVLEGWRWLQAAIGGPSQDL